MNDQEISPSRWYYGLAALVFIGGAVSFGLILIRNISGMGDKLKQVVVPGKVDITLSEPGNYTIFHEHRSVVGQKVYSTEEGLSGLECALVSKATGSKINLARSSVNSRYSLGSRSGVSVFDFRIDQPGSYEFSAGYAEGRDGPEVVLAIGQGFVGNILATILGSIAVLFGSILVAAAMALITYIKREKAEKRLKSAPALYRPIA